jgi:hypothetical protein
MADPYLTATITIIGGVTVYVLGQIISKFFIEPYHEYRKTVGEIAYTLTYYANVSAAQAKEELQDEASKAFRQNASRLKVTAFQIPFFRLLPRFQSVMHASAGLIGLSNVVYRDNWDHIDKHRNKIVENLRLEPIERSQEL